ncbi:pulmonary surfactant-associated protein B-like [Lissotriton helveticus]
MGTMVAYRGLLLALGSLASAVTGNVLLREECGQGAEYWCQNLVTAMRCGAVEHCLQAEWNPQQLREEGNLCDECKLIVTTAGTMVKDPSLQDFIKRVLHHECTLIPVKNLVPYCHLLVDNYFAGLMSLLESYINPNTICSAVGLCKANQSGEKLLINQVWDQLFPLWKWEDFKWPNGETGSMEGPEAEFSMPMPLCWICRSFIGRLESAIPKAALAKSASQLCLLLPAKVAGVCQCTVEKYTIIIIDFILGKLGPRLICGLVDMCAMEETSSPDVHLIPVPGRDLRCETCLAVTALLKSSFQQNITGLQMEQALTKACISHNLDWHECQQFIPHHQQELFAVLSKQWDHKTPCQEIGVCATVEEDQTRLQGCDLGPAYWCLSMANAIECKTVDHCKFHVWG